MSALIHQSRRFQSRREYTYPELRPAEAPQRRIRLVAGSRPKAVETGGPSEAARG
jgi:hypothetical protein